mmetsp:Transcript_9069/g.27829  ORF Transcript_9069/g.27829 Transcript_9069/m.27829 type:complete len:226 (-) Transcript_9069:80-757(-)
MRTRRFLELIAAPRHWSALTDTAMLSLRSASMSATRSRHRRKARPARRRATKRRNTRRSSFALRSKRTTARHALKPRLLESVPVSRKSLASRSVSATRRRHVRSAARRAHRRQRVRHFERAALRHFSASWHRRHCASPTRSRCLLAARNRDVMLSATFARWSVLARHVAKAARRATRRSVRDATRWRSRARSVRVFEAVAHRRKPQRSRDLAIRSTTRVARTRFS